MYNLSREKGLKAARQDFTGRAFERKPKNEERYFSGTLELNYGWSKLVIIFWIRRLKRIILKLFINAKTQKSIFPALGSSSSDRSHIFFIRMIIREVI